MNPYQIVRDFESALCDYTGAKYAVTTTSCTMALLLACAWHRQYPPSIIPGHYPEVISIPKHTYVGVPMSIMHAGFDVSFRSEDWLGYYSLQPLPVYDSARFFSSGIFHKNEFMCVSFHWTKTLAIGQGGAILHDNDEADEWFRMMRFDGRMEGIEPRFQKDWVLGYHCYMSPRDAAEGLSRLAVLPEVNGPLPNDDYPDLSKLEIFK